MAKQKEAKAKHPGGRPTKLIPTFLEATKKVLQDENVVFLTDEELLFLINEKLPDETMRISPSTFEKWKAGKVQDDANGKEFLRLVKSALILEKNHLFHKLESVPKDWQKYAWIIERKFKEWRMPNKFEIGGDPENKTPLTIITKVPDECYRDPV